MSFYELTADQLKELMALDRIHITWKDYALMLLNSTNEPLRSIWREKVLTSFSHWHMHSGSISEGNLAGLEVLADLPNALTELVVDDSYGPDGPFSWRKEGRLSGSKRMKVHIGNYPQESLSNEANLCIKYIVAHWDEYGHLISEIDLLNRMWKLAQMSGGKCLLPDEVLTYILERPINDRKHGSWIDACLDVFANGIPSSKYDKYWRSEKIEGFPDISHIIFDPANPGYDSEEKELYISLLFDEYTCDLPLDEQKQNFMDLCDVMLKEDVAFSPCWKKICICILKNDVSFKYAGFGATLRERQAREEAIAAFSTKQEEKKKAKADAEALAKKIEEENKANQ